MASSGLKTDAECSPLRLGRVGPPVVSEECIETIPAVPVTPEGW